MDSGGKAKTYRVRQLPSMLAYKKHVASFLASLVPDLEAEDVRVMSLATSLDPFEIPSTKIATVMFECLPLMFRDGKDSWTISGREAGLLKDVLVDTHFEAFTPLNDPTQGDHEFDCIAVSGLASHPFGSWKQRGSDTTFMWLRDRLPRDLPNVRSIIYGYDSALVQSESVKDIDDIAITFIGRLRAIGRASPAAKPLLILAHSLGGIVVKQALLLMAQTGDSSTVILDSIRGVMFFGVPNQGMRISHLRPMVADRPNAHLIEVLSERSSFLKELDQRFSGIVAHRSILIVSVYETRRSATTRRLPSGQWTRDGPFELLVSKNSAIQKNSDEVISVDQDHSNMVKFSEADQDCQAVIRLIAEMTTASTRISSIVDSYPQNREEHAIPSESVDARAESAKAEKTEAMLKSLRLQEAGLRRDEIEARFESTFEWFFDKEELGYETWLRDSAPVYWISGKPGSGKSTLMKCARQHDRTLVGWPPSSRDEIPLIVDFFFHDRGTKMQKSLEGLLYSVLSAALDSATELVDLVLPLFKLDRHGVQGWPLHDLRKALDLIMRQPSVELSILLFLDALDEFDGEAQAIVDFVNYLTTPYNDSRTKLKVCCSSRPLNAFQDAFGSGPGCRIHEHTQGDIESYINGRFLGNARMREMMEVRYSSSKGANAAERLKFEVANRAEGVFVWVRLVLDDLLSACTDGARVDELASILSKFPVDLVDIYRRAIERVPYRYRDETYIIIETLLRNHDVFVVRDLGLLLICATASSPASAAKQLPQDPYSDDFYRSTRRRLQSRCGGMVQVLYDTRVQFMHQTVKEFFSRPGATKAILDPTPTFHHQNGYSFLAKFYLTLASATRTEFDWPEYMLSLFDGEAQYLPMSHYRVERPLLRKDLDFLRRQMRHLSRRPEYHYPRREIRRFNFLSRAGFSPFESIRKCMGYARLSEATTGWSQLEFFDQLPEETWLAFTKDDNRRISLSEWDHAPRTLSSFAQVADLRLCLAEIGGPPERRQRRASRPRRRASHPRRRASHPRRRSALPSGSDSSGASLQTISSSSL